MAEIDILSTMGEDALGNHFAIVIPAINQLGANTANLNMRITNVTIPPRKIITYEIPKRGRSFTRPNGKIDQEKTLTFTFRQDKNFLCYKSLCNWMQFIQNNVTGGMASDSGPNGLGGASEYRHNIEVWSINGLDNSTPNSIWTFEGAYPTEVSSIEFSEDESDALTCDVTMECKNVIYPSI